MSSYYVRRMGYLLGQFSAAELKARAQSGELQPDDEVSRDQERWVPARDIGGLGFRVAPPPVPTHFDPADPLSSLNGAEPSAPRAIEARTPNLAACPDCLELVSMRAVSCPHCGCPIKSLPEWQPTGRTNGLLRFFGIIYVIGGLGVTLLGVGILILGWSNEYRGLEVAIALCGLGPTWMVIGEAIQVFLDIEENTRQVANDVYRRR